MPSPTQRFITNILKQSKITRYRLGTLAGVDPDMIYGALTRNTSLRTLERMLAALDIRLVAQGHELRYKLGEDGTVSGRESKTKE